MYPNEISGIDQAAIPPIDPAVKIVPGGPDPLVNLPRELAAKPGEVVTVPVKLDTADGLEAAQVRLAYDASALEVVDSLHERKARMAELADAFVALPGGFGTLDELLEQLTWSQLGLHERPIGLLDVEGFWRPLIALARHATDEGFVRESDLAAIAVADDPEALLDRLERLTGEARPRPKWS